MQPSTEPSAGGTVPVREGSFGSHPRNGPGVGSLGPRSGPAAELTLDRFEPLHLRTGFSWREYQEHEAGLRWSGATGAVEVAGGFDRDAEPHFWGIGADSHESNTTSYLRDRVHGRVGGTLRTPDMASLSAEWRYEIWRELHDRMRLEGFVFGDEGAVARRLDEVASSDWRPSFGAGLRLVGPRPPVPLRPEPIPYADTVPVDEPEARSSAEAGRPFEIATGDQLVRPFDLRRRFGDGRPALNLTRDDDVVGSAWWEPRLGYDDIPPEDVAEGPPGGLPDTVGDLTVIAGKSAGISAGFTVRDRRGREFLLKLDPEGNPRLASGAGIISARLLWAAGYHVPGDEVAVFDPDRLEIAADATIATPDGERGMREGDVARILALTDSLPGGLYRALFSPLLEGTPKGPFYFSGRRDDDPNDYYPHEHRRELRGLYVVSAWLNHVDMRFANTLDVYVPEGYLKHHLIDFAATLGSGTVRPHMPREGREYNVDIWPVLGRLASMGLYRPGWESEAGDVIHPAVG